MDATFFTDRHESPLAPSECDLTFEVAGGLVDTLQLHVAYERDMPIDREGLVQQLVLVFLTWDMMLVH